MAANELPWNQTPGYLSMSSWVIPPGGRKTYVVPRPTGSRPSDKTSFHPGQVNWSKDNLTEIMYQLYPSKSWKVFAHSTLPPVKLDAQGDPMEEKYPDAGIKARPLLAFDILPDKVGTMESPLLLEEWRRYDGRIRWQDIIMRMPQPRPTQNILNMRAIRMRADYCMLSWHAKAKYNEENASRDAVLARLSDKQIAANTTRGITPGLRNPSLGAAGGIILPRHKKSRQDQPRKQFKSKTRKLNAKPRLSHKAPRLRRPTRKAKKTVAEPESSDVETDGDRDTVIDNNSLSSPMANVIAVGLTENTVEYIDRPLADAKHIHDAIRSNEPLDYYSDSPVSSPPPESDIEALYSPLLHSYEQRRKNKRKRQDISEPEEPYKRRNDMVLAERDPVEKLALSSERKYPQWDLGVVGRGNGKRGHIQKQPMGPVSSPNVPYAAHMRQRHAYNDDSLTEPAAPRWPYFTASQPLPQDSTDLSGLQNAASPCYQDHTQSLDFQDLDNEIGTQDIGSHQGHISQETSTDAGSTMSRSDSASSLPIDPTEPWDSSQEVDIEFWENHFRCAETKINQSFQTADTVDGERWLEPEHLRAGWSDTFTTY